MRKFGETSARELQGGFFMIAGALKDTENFSFRP